MSQYTREIDLLADCSAQPLTPQAKRSVFIAASLDTLSNMRAAEVHESNFGTFPLSVIAFALGSSVLASCAILRSADVGSDALLSLMAGIVGIAGVSSALSIWLSRWSSYSLSPCRRSIVLLVVVGALAVACGDIALIYTFPQSWPLKGIQFASALCTAASGAMVVLSSRKRLASIAASIVV